MAISSRSDNEKVLKSWSHLITESSTSVSDGTRSLEMCEIDIIVLVNKGIKKMKIMKTFKLDTHNVLLKHFFLNWESSKNLGLWRRVLKRVILQMLILNL